MSPAREARSREWVVDLRSHRVVRRVPIRLNSDAEDQVTDKKTREQALKALNPIEDIKGAVNYLKHMDPVEDIKEFMETAVEVLDPRESDVRAIRPEEDSHSEVPDTK